MTKLQCPLVPASAAFEQEAVRLANRYRLCMVRAAELDTQIPFILLLDKAGLSLQVQPVAQKEFGRSALYVDFAGDSRFRTPMRVSDPLAKALGVRSGVRPMVWDMTGGLGRDAWAIASVGCQVVVYERHPVVAALLADGLRRARESDLPTVRKISERIELVHGDATEFLPTSQLDVLYFDPMFPERNKSALVKKEMRIFRALVGEDLDASQLLEKACASGARRVVVKRLLHAPLVSDQKPTYQIKGSRLRFDVYLMT